MLESGRRCPRSAALRDVNSTWPNAYRDKETGNTHTHTHTHTPVARYIALLPRAYNKLKNLTGTSDGLHLCLGSFCARLAETHAAVDGCAGNMDVI